MEYYNEKERQNITLIESPQVVTFVNVFTEIPKIYIEDPTGIIDIDSISIDRVTFTGNVIDKCKMIVCEK